jgi:regulator of sirC expression with transglutaminase-like and TPR domain
MAKKNKKLTKEKDDFDKFLEEHLKNPEFKREYDKLGKEYAELVREIEERIDKFLKNKEKLTSLEEIQDSEKRKCSTKKRMM